MRGEKQLRCGMVPPKPPSISEQAKDTANPKVQRTTFRPQSSNDSTSQRAGLSLKHEKIIKNNPKSHPGEQALKTNFQRGGPPASSDNPVSRNEMETPEITWIETGPGEKVLVQARKRLPDPPLPGAPLFQHIFSRADVQNKPPKSKPRTSKMNEHKVSKMFPSLAGTEKFCRTPERIKPCTTGKRHLKLPPLSLHLNKMFDRFRQNGKILKIVKSFLYVHKKSLISELYAAMRKVIKAKKST
ncbi:hypothetical protein DUI87_15019 [Hirundo rustica rustica]|uniref:Uncharacterized protein n=1 Tax=Hirundo rustica rustica TaxID=333673 RepID=A0A3M0K6I6_HIRRU|nr:hypothetical protein DUI87_15019 [Hirundo rustica rustica]